MRAINAQGAWAAGKLGSASVKVGILDTGLSYNTPDLNGRVDLALSKSFLVRSHRNGEYVEANFRQGRLRAEKSGKTGSSDNSHPARFAHVDMSAETAVWKWLAWQFTVSNRFRPV